MSTIDPFAEPDDTEGTIIRPRPAGAASPAPRAAEPPPRDAGTARPIPKVGINPLIAAASPILAAAMRVASSRGAPPDPDRLRGAMVKAMRGFETEALATGLDTKALRAARYALCATIDDIVLSTPWGSSSSWVQQSLTSVFHNEVIGGERFFDILEEMQADLGRYAPVVELMYLCTSLGFEGRYRVMPRGVAALTELRDGVYRTIRTRRGDFERDLSPHWKGVKAGMRSLASRIPLWVIGVITLALLAALYVWFTFVLAGMSDVAFDELASIPPKEPQAVRHVRPAGLPPPPPRAPGAPAAPAAPGTPLAVPTPVAAPPTAAQTTPPPSCIPGLAPTQPTPSATEEPLVARLNQSLANDIRAGLVCIMSDQQAITVRLANRNMFDSGSATLGNSYLSLLGRIGEALETAPGQIIITGYTDNQKIRTARFPSNYELSQARAEAVAAVVKGKLAKPDRVVARGRGDSDPIASNATADGRQQNRRTEIGLIRPSNQP